jgi:hypothetical protein
VRAAAYLDRSAVLSGDGLYRYLLSRRWGKGIEGVLWVMLNPSTADGMFDDPTIRRCVNFSKGWGYSHLSVVNLYGLRVTQPKHLADHPDPVGRDNDWMITDVLLDGSLSTVMAAWGGTVGPNPDRRARVLDIVKVSQLPVRCLGYTHSGEPRHPLYVRSAQEQRWFPQDAEHAHLAEGRQ